jgi:ribosome biogenesis GTPase
LPDLEALGWDAERATEFEPHAAAGLVPGRVAVQHRGAYDVLTKEGELRSEVPARMVREAASLAELPAVGDWVALEPTGDATGTVRAVLARRSRFSRKRAGDTAEEQVLAANVDIAFLVSSLNEDLNLRRLERYLILAWDSGASPVVLLTKADIADDVPGAIADVASVAVGIPVLAVSARTGEGMDAVMELLAPGVTAVLLGSSGVGKSTIVNALLGEDRLKTQEIRDDGRGRHTTVRRELVQLPGGGLLVDTPGIRELQLWTVDDGLDEAFEDVTSLFAQCRFSDCRHDAEPGCAVKEALADGRLAPERWESYVKLQRELELLERRVDKRAAAEQRRRIRNFSKEIRRIYESRGRHR